MIRIIIAYIATMLVFALCDLFWLTQVGPSLYQPYIGSILLSEPRMDAAIAFYAIYIAGLVYFAVLPGIAGGGWQTSLLKGALLGFVSYATYDLTNQATLIVWSNKITLADMGWGTFVSAVASAAGCAITPVVCRWFGVKG